MSKQSEEIKEKYKPFYRDDIDNWCLWESLLLGWTKIPLVGITWIFLLYVACLILELINWTKFDPKKPIHPILLKLYWWILYMHGKVIFMITGFPMNLKTH